MREKKTEITWNGKKHEVAQQPLNFGERNDCLRQSMDKRTEIVDKILFQELRICKSIKVAPFNPTLEQIRKLSVEDGDALKNALDELEGISEVEKGEIELAAKFPPGSQDTKT